MNTPYVIVEPQGSIFLGNVYHAPSLPLHKWWVFPTYEQAEVALARVPVTGNGRHAIAQLLAQPEVFGWEER